jgi:alkyl sulfatase BDS1-like metallo-beta-lactamase superfamily hydrolase
MASVEQCEQALRKLAANLSGASPDDRKKVDFDRQLSCALPDLGITFLGHLHDGTLDEIRQTAANPPADVRLTMKSDDLLALVGGQLNLATAIATGRVKVSAGVRDLLKLRTAF